MSYRHGALFYLQLAFAISALSYVLWLVEWTRAAQILLQADIIFLGAAFLLLLAGFVFAAIRWSSLLHTLSVRYTWVAAYRAYLTGSFYGLTLPGVIGGDVARIWLCLRETQAPIILITGTVLVERVLGAAALFLILSIGIYLHNTNDINTSPAWTLLSAFILVGGVAALPSIFHRSSRRVSGGTLPHYSKPAILLRRISRKLAPLMQFTTPNLLTGIVYSSIFQIFDILSTYALSHAIGYDLNIKVLLIALPIVYLATILPISPGGLGVREGTLVIVLSQFGLDGADAALLALTVFLNRVAVGLVGAVQHMATGASIFKKYRHYHTIQ